MLDTAHLKYLSIHLDEKGQKVIASFVHVGDKNAITLDDFKQAINTAGFGGYSLNESAMGTATTKYNSGEAFEIAVGEALDGTFSIRIDNDLMAAYLTCTLPLGGAPVQLEIILQEAGRKGITVQLDAESIKNALKEGGDNVLIASGKAPVHGVDGKIESLIPNMSNRSPQLDSHNIANFRELGEIITVKPGDALMRRTPPTSGEPGITVTGKVIPANPGKDVVFGTSRNGVIIDPKDPNLLIAAINGLPVQKKGEVSVEPTYTVKNVDLHTGNITFDGMVHVTEDVYVGMSIKATGDIHVDGIVEGAILDAGGDIIVKGGIIGEPEQGDHMRFAITCSGTCTARFVQNAYITAGQGIFIHESAIQSRLTAGHQIIVGDKGSRKGIIIGGVICAPMLVKAQTIGSNANIKTVIIAGANELLHDRLKAAIKTREDVGKKLSDIINLLKLASLSPGRIPVASVKAAEITRDTLNSEIEILRENDLDLQAEISLANGAQIIAEKQIFGGVEIRFGIKRQNISSAREGGIFRLNEGEIVFN